MHARDRRACAVLVQSVLESKGQKWDLLRAEEEGGAGARRLVVDVGGVEEKK